MAYERKEILLMVRLAVDYCKIPNMDLEEKLKDGIISVLKEKQVLFNDIGFVVDAESKARVTKDGTKILFAVTKEEADGPCECPVDSITEASVKFTCTKCGKQWYDDAAELNAQDGESADVYPRANNNFNSSESDRVYSAEWD